MVQFQTSGGSHHECPCRPPRSSVAVRRPCSESPPPRSCSACRSAPVRSRPRSRRPGRPRSPSCGSRRRPHRPSRPPSRSSRCASRSASSSSCASTARRRRRTCATPCARAGRRARSCSATTSPRRRSCGRSPASSAARAAVTPDRLHRPGGRRDPQRRAGRRRPPPRPARCPAGTRRAAARALRQLGINVTLAPVADVPSVAGAAMGGREFSSDPDEASAAVQGVGRGLARRRRGHHRQALPRPRRRDHEHRPRLGVDRRRSHPRRPRAVPRRDRRPRPADHELARALSAARRRTASRRSRRRSSPTCCASSSATRAS